MLNFLNTPRGSIPFGAFLLVFNLLSGIASIGSYWIILYGVLAIYGLDCLSMGIVGMIKETAPAEK